MYYIIAFGLMYSLKGITNDNLILYFVPDFILLVGIFRHAFVNEVKLYLRKVEKSANYYPYLALAVILGLSLIRSSYPGSNGIDHFTDLLTFFLFNVLVYSVLSGPFRTRDYFDAIFTRGTLTIITIASAWVALFFILSIVGSFESGSRFQSQIENSTILGLLGITVKAKPIPFTEGIRFSHLSILAAGTILINFLGLRMFSLEPWKKNLLYGSMGICGITILLSDSLGALVSLLLTAGVVYYYFRFRESRFIRIGIWVVPLLPIVFMVIFSGLFGSSFSSEINAAEQEEISSFTRRMILWEKSTDHLLSPGIGHIWGEGQYGNVGAGVNDAYHDILPQNNIRQVELPRNTIFQTFSDLGLLGTVAFILAMIVCFDNAIYLFDRGYMGGIIYASFIIFTAFASIFESLVGLYSFPFMGILIMMMVGAIVFRNEFDRIASEDWN